MATTFRTIGMPEHLFRVRDGSFDLENIQTNSDSILSRFVRVSGLIEQRWACQLDLASAERSVWQEWQSFRARLSGQAVLFTIRAPLKRLPLGRGAGFAETNDPITITGTTITGTTILEGSTTALIATAAARYQESVIMEFPTSLAGETVLTPGDLFGLGGNLYMVVANVVPDAAGLARVPFRWRLWKGASVGDIVSFREPTCRVQLRTANEGITQLHSAGHGDAGFAAAEVPYV